MKAQATNVKSPLTTPVLSLAFASLITCSASVAVQAADFEKSKKPAYTLKIVTHGENDNRSHNLDSTSRQDNRRADVKIETVVQNGTREVTTETNQQVKVKVSDALKRSIRLKDGGVIWVSKDPASLTPKLNINTNSTVEINDNTFVNPISFTIKTNYADFIDSWELTVYKTSDEDRVNPVATFMGRDLSTGRTIKWNGTTTKNHTLKADDNLSYILEVKDKKGHIDKTHAQNIRLIHSSNTIANADTELHKFNSKFDEQLTSRVLENKLKLQTIPLQGSQVRIHGSDIAKGNTIKINGESVTVNDGKFLVEKLLPDGKHTFDVAIKDNNQQQYNKALDVDLKGKYLFMVALADVTIGEGKVTGNVESLSEADKYLDGDIFVDGRLAFYLKGKVKGKYLVTAQMDTGTEDIEDLFDDIHKKDPESLFRRLDPDKYYPVYGDDSTLIDDTDSQGKIYVRVDWDKSRALWGNYNTDFTGTELSSFNRSLYGAKVNHKSTKVTESGDHKTDVTVFASEAQSAFRHNEFLGTGGSLYYLKDTDIVDGSEKVWIEIRDRDGSQRVIERIIMEEGRDYEIDDFQGRIILNRPLTQIAKQSGPSLVKDTPLDGNNVYLMVDYEYVPDDFDADKASYGARGKVWVNDHIALGATYVHEDRVQNDYDLKGVDITLKKGNGTYIKGEYAESDANQTSASLTSIDGGLNFDAINDENSNSSISGSAFSIEARANLEEISNKEGTIGAWYKEYEAGFSKPGIDTSVDTIDTGIEAIIQATDKVNVALRATLLDKNNQQKTTTEALQIDYDVNDKLTLSGEVRHVDEDDQTASNNDGEAVLGAFKVGYDVNRDVNLYAIAQSTLSRDGNYDENDLFTLGTTAKINSKLDINAEVSTGDRGDSATIGAAYQVNDGYKLYSNYILSEDTIDLKRSTFTIGQRKTVSNKLKVYSEHQFTRDKEASGIGRVYGLDYQVNKALTASASLQKADLDKASSGLTKRDAFSVGLNYQQGKTDANTRLEFRRDKGDAENTEQWVTTNRIKYQLNPSLRLQGKFNHSETKDKLGNTRDARFTEASLGFAFRPVHNDRHNILGRITYLYDLQPLSQSAQPDERSLIASIENTYQVNQKWEIGGKLAHKVSEIRADRDSGAWSDNDATLVAARVRYHLTHKWDAMAEYHWMNSDASQDTKHGALISVDRHIGKNMKIGIGYNFTDFDDDLSDTSGTAKGWFINLIGKY